MSKRRSPKYKPNWKSGDKIPKYGIYGWFHGEDKTPWFDILGEQHDASVGYGVRHKVSKKNNSDFYYTWYGFGSNYFRPARREGER